MHYECSCGYVAASATQFYKHLASSKESGEGHQLTQARFAEKNVKSGRATDDQIPPPAGAPGGAASSGPPSWVDEYLLVDQRDVGTQQPQAGTPAPGSYDRHPPGALPVSTGAPRSAAAAPPAAPVSTGSELEGVSLREMAGASRGWSLSRQRSSGTSRPPLPALSNCASMKASVSNSVGLGHNKQAEADVDRIELLDQDNNRNYHRRPSGGLAEASSGTPGAGPGNSTAQAALRMSGTVVNAMVVGLSPWRWFGPPGGTGAAAAQQQQELGPGLGGEGRGAQGAAAAAQGARSDGEGAGALAQRQPRTSLAGACGAAAVSPAAPPPDEPFPHSSLAALHTVRDVLIWRSPWHTGRIFGAGLYLAVCARQVMKGHDLLQPSTAVFTLCFLVLLRNVVREAMANYRRVQQPQQQGDAEGPADAAAGGTGMASALASPSPRADSVERKKAAAELQQRVEAVLQPVAVGAAHYGSALVVLALDLLSGRRAITSALVAALLWTGMVVGELRVMSQPMFWMLCYLSVFTIPAAYYRCRRAMDAGVEAVLRFVVRVLVSGTRTSLLTAAAVAAVLVAVVPLNLVLRATLAGAGSFGVLLWQFDPRAQWGGEQAGGGGDEGAGAKEPAAQGPLTEGLLAAAPAAPRRMLTAGGLGGMSLGNGGGGGGSVQPRE